MRIDRTTFGKDQNVFVSVVVPTTRKRIVTLESIKELVDSYPISVEVIVVHETDPKLEHRKNRSRARNIGVDVASGRILFFLDDDVSFEPEEFKKALDTILTTRKTVTGGVYLEPWMKLPTIGTRFVALTKHAFRDIGGFNESLCAFEDWEFTIRALLRGYKLVDCAPRHEHHHERNFRELLYRNIVREMHGTLMVMMYAKYLRGRVLRWFFPIFVRHSILANNLWRNALTRGIVRIIGCYYWNFRKILMHIQKSILAIRGA